jgi:hypothetical protein
MKSPAQKRLGVKKISKILKQTIGATAVKAHTLRVSLAADCIYAASATPAKMKAIHLDHIGLVCRDEVLTQAQCVDM